MKRWKNWARALLMSTALCVAPAAAQAQSVYTMSGNLKISWGLTAANVPQGWSAGWTGSGVRIGVFDTGVNASLSNWGPNILPGWDAINNRAGATKDNQWHGTFVTSIIASQTNMRGVAYNSQIIPVIVSNSKGSVTATDHNIGVGIDFAVKNGARVLNNSWNSSLTLSDLGASGPSNMLKYWYPKEIAAWNRAVAEGVIVVFAAGNNSKKDPGFYAAMPLVSPTLQGGWLSVVATDQTGKLASYSNKCGVTAAFCLAAPGSNIIGLYVNGVSTASGTSFAAPIVSGAVALLRQQWPYLTNTQITTILLSTANKSGIYSDSLTYGQGFLDVNKAVQPLGIAGVPMTSTVQGSTISITSTGISASPLLVKALSAGLGSTPVLVLDSVNRAYAVQGSTFVRSFDPAKRMSATDIIGQFGVAHTSNGVSWQGTNNGQSASFNLTQGPAGGSVAYSNNASLGWAFGPIGNNVIRMGEMAVSSQVTNPYLNLQPGTSGGAVSWQVNKFSLKMGAFQTSDRSTLGMGFNPTRSQGFVSEIGYKYSESLNLSMTIGSTQEQGTYLGSASSGATSLGQNASTSYVGLAFDHSLSHKLSLVGGAFSGVTTSSGGNSMVRMGAIQTANAYLGVVGSGVWDKNDRMGFVAGIPTTVVSGTARFTVPISRDFDGNISSVSFSRGMAASTVPTTAQLFYNKPLSQSTTLNMSAAMQHNPGSKAGVQQLALIKIVSKF